MALGSNQDGVDEYSKILVVMYSKVNYVSFQSWNILFSEYRVHIVINVCSKLALALGSNRL
jgi:hypothetical protein